MSYSTNKDKNRKFFSKLKFKASIPREEAFIYRDKKVSSWSIFVLIFIQVHTKRPKFGRLSMNFLFCFEVIDNIVNLITFRTLCREDVMIINVDKVTGID